VSTKYKKYPSREIIILSISNGSIAAICLCFSAIIGFIIFISKMLDGHKPSLSVFDHVFSTLFQLPLIAAPMIAFLIIFNIIIKSFGGIKVTIAE
jgi:hypothetical protein